MVRKISSHERYGIVDAFIILPELNESQLEYRV